MGWDVCFCCCSSSLKSGWVVNEHIESQRMQSAAITCVVWSFVLILCNRDDRCLDMHSYLTSTKQRIVSSNYSTYLHLQYRDEWQLMHCKSATGSLCNKCLIISQNTLLSTIQMMLLMILVQDSWRLGSIGTCTINTEWKINTETGWIFSCIPRRIAISTVILRRRQRGLSVLCVVTTWRRNC